MTKKHFEALADALSKSRPIESIALAQWDQSVRDVARVCADSNSQFDRDKFVEACEWGR